MLFCKAPYSPITLQRMVAQKVFHSSGAPLAAKWTANSQLLIKKTSFKMPSELAKTLQLELNGRFCLEHNFGDKVQYGVTYTKM